MLNEAIGIVETCIVTVEGVNTAMNPGTNHPMGVAYAW